MPVDIVASILTTLLIVGIIHHFDPRPMIEEIIIFLASLMVLFLLGYYIIYGKFIRY